MLMLHGIILIFFQLMVLTFSKKVGQIVLKKLITYTQDGINVTSEIELRHYQLLRWKIIVNKFCLDKKIDCNIIHNYIVHQLEILGYSKEIIQGNSKEIADDFFLSCHEASHNLLDTSFSKILLFYSSAVAINSLNCSNIQYTKETLFTEKESFSTSPFLDMCYILNIELLLSNKMVDIKLSNPTNKIAKIFESSFPIFLRNSNESNYILIYQSLNANTGGSAVMKLLYEALLLLQYNSILCTGIYVGKEQSKHDADRCTHPQDIDIVVTGEWCNGVLAEHGVHFQGRGVQYHLGHHHWSDLCRGFVTIANSRHLSVTLADRILGAYHLAPPMANRYLLAYLAGLRTGTDTVLKEDLVVIDPDIATDYPPEQPIGYTLPARAKVVVAKGFTPDQMVLLLQRAKVVVDLALPGPERLASEGILMGALPVLSSRWHGASEADYPGARRVDHTDPQEVYQAVEQALDHHPQQLEQSENRKLLLHVVSMWRKFHRTVDIFFGSSKLHFFISAPSLLEEHLAVFQVLCISYLYPLASITLLVRDVKWFLRQHYAFYSLLRTAGLVRSDPFDPAEMDDWANGTGTSFVSIQSLSADLSLPRHTAVLLPLGLTPQHPQDLLLSLVDLPRSGHLSWPAAAQEAQSLLAIGPDAADDTKRLLLSDWLAGLPVAASATSPPPLLHVCRLLQPGEGLRQEDEEEPNDRFHVSDVLYSLPWRETAYRAKRSFSARALCGGRSLD